MSHPKTIVVVQDSSDTVVVRDRSANTSVVADPDRLVHVAAAGARGPQGPPGPAGSGAGGELLLTAAQNIPARHVVAINGDGLAYIPDRDTPSDANRVAGVSAVAALAGEQFTVVVDGVLEGGPWPVGALFLGDSGALTADPSGGSFQLQVGVAVTSTRILIRPQFPIFL